MATPRDFAELSAANRAMARMVARLSQSGDLRSFLDDITREVAAAIGADAVALVLIEDGTFRSPTMSHVVNGQLVPPDPLAPELPVAGAPFLDRLRSSRRAHQFEVEGDGHLFWPGAVEFHRAQGHKRVVSTLLWVDDEFVGMLSLALRREEPLEATRVSLFDTLATQAAFAVKLTRLAELAEQEGTRRAVERARAESAETHVALLQAANDSLRRGTERVGEYGGLEALLGAFLLEAMNASGAAGGGITQWRDQRFSRHLAIAQDGSLVPIEQWRDEPMILETAEVFARDDGGFSTLLLSQPITRSTLAEARVWWPAAAEYHARRGHVEVWNVPCALRGRLLAHLGLAFREPREMDPITVGTLTSLAQQMTLALELTSLGEAAKQAAIELETTRAVAAERQRMAGEIHDSLAQSFTSIALQSESLISDLDEHSPLRATLEVIEETARLGLAEARSSVLALRPIGDAIGELQDALEQLAERCNIAGSVNCEFRTGTHPCALDADVRDAVLRVAQEAVNNALRHSGAGRLLIEFDVHEEEAVLSVADDGAGMTRRTSERRGGFGIAGMRARAESLGGTLTLTNPADGEGTVVCMRVPRRSEKASSSSG